MDRVGGRSGRFWFRARELSLKCLGVGRGDLDLEGNGIRLSSQFMVLKKLWWNSEHGDEAK